MTFVDDRHSEYEKLKFYWDNVNFTIEPNESFLLVSFIRFVCVCLSTICQTLCLSIFWHGKEKAIYTSLKFNKGHTLKNKKNFLFLVYFISWPSILNIQSLTLTRDLTSEWYKDMLNFLTSHVLMNKLTSIVSVSSSSNWHFIISLVVWF